MPPSCRSDFDSIRVAHQQYGEGSVCDGGQLGGRSGAVAEGHSDAHDTGPGELLATDMDMWGKQCTCHTHPVYTYI